MSRALQTACRLLPKSHNRTLTDRAAGPGGLFRSSSPIVNPSARAAAASKTRLQQLRACIEERCRPDELNNATPPFETEGELRDFVEMRIQESMRQGQFDNLKNKGRPLPGPPASSSLDVAMRIMRENGVRPYWLQLMHDIDGEKRLIRRELQWAWHRFMPDRRERWEGVVRVAVMRFESVNKAVDTFNLVRPGCVGHLFRLRLRVEEEVKRARESERPQELDKRKEKEESDRGVNQTGMEEPRKSWQLFARFVRANEVKEYERPTWGRRRVGKDERGEK